MQIERLDHFVLTVRDVEATISFYRRVLGMAPVTFGAGRRALAFGQSKINLHSADAPIPPHAQHPVAGSADLCFITSGSIESVIDHLRVRRDHRSGTGPAHRRPWPDNVGLPARPRWQPHRTVVLSPVAAAVSCRPDSLQPAPVGARRGTGGVQGAAPSFLPPGDGRPRPGPAPGRRSLFIVSARGAAMPFFYNVVWSEFVDGPPWLLEGDFLLPHQRPSVGC